MTRLLFLQDLPAAYVSICLHLGVSVFDQIVSYILFVFQLVCFYYVLTTFTTVGYGEH
jgi:hypothetical protein